MGRAGSKGKSKLNVLRQSEKSKADGVLKSKKPRSPYFDYEYEQEVEFTCPVRGKVKQKVMIKRFKTQLEPSEKHVVPNSLSPLEEAELKNGGISLSDLEEQETGANTSEDEEPT